MWFEILPSFGIVFAALSLPSAGVYWINKVGLGNPYKRDTRQEYNKYLYLRDWGLTGDVYKQQGLEAIPDPEPVPEPPKKGWRLFRMHRKD